MIDLLENEYLCITKDDIQDLDILSGSKFVSGDSLCGVYIKRLLMQFGTIYVRKTTKGIVYSSHTEDVTARAARIYLLSDFTHLSISEDEMMSLLESGND